MTALPSSVISMDVQLFREFLADQGAELYPAKSPYEVIRYRWLSQTHIVYRNERNRLKWTGESGEHYQRMLEKRGLSLKPNGAGTTLKSSRRPEIREKLLARDGNSCWLCDNPMVLGDPEHPHACTIEHLWPRERGGPNTLDNLVLCGFACNQRLGNIGLIEKIKLRDEFIEQRADLGITRWGSTFRVEEC